MANGRGTASRDEVRRKQYLSQSEADFQAELLSVARIGKWWWYHTYNSKRSPKGFPDLVLVRGREMVFAELKSETGKLTAEQKRVLPMLELVSNHNPHVYVFLWRPSDLPEATKFLMRPIK